MPSSQKGELVRGLGVWGAASIVVGTVIGSGIFLVASSMTRGVGTPAMVFFVWIFGGLLSLTGALAYAELGAMMPESGGEYAYLRESYGPLWAFLYGWSQFLVMKTASVATLATGFALYLSIFFPGLNIKAVAVSLVAVLAVVNYFGVRTGGAVQTFFTVLKVGLILALVVAALLFGKGDWSHFSTSVPVTSPVSGFVAALVAALWAYDGWNNLNMAGGEVSNPQRNIPRSLVLGTMAVGVIYVAANIAYFYVLSAPEVAASSRVAGDVALRFLGDWGGRAVALAAMVSIFAATNGSILSGARVPFAMARDGLFFRPLGEVHPKFRSPHIAVLTLSAFGAIMCLTGGYDELFTYVIFASWIYYGLTVSAIFVLRRKHPDWPRPYRAWGYPVLPALFVIVSGWLVIMTLKDQAWWRSLIGLGIIALGVPAFYYFSGRRSRAAAGVMLLAAVFSLPANAASPPPKPKSRPAPANEVVLFTLTEAAALESLRVHADKAMSVAPQWYSAAEDGTISGTVSQAILDRCRASGIALTPTVINAGFSASLASGLLASRTARGRFARELIARAHRHDFAGYVIDFENLRAEKTGRRNFTTLLQELRAAFQAHRLTLAVALPAPSARNFDTFDYKAVGRLAGRVVLMAYDQHTRLSPPGPIAGYRWVEDSVRQTMKLVPGHKLLLGVAFYHRNWGEWGATAGSYNEALALRKEFNANLRWHPLHRAHWFGFSREGRAHTVWVEDAHSVAEKLALARRYKLAGVAGWRLGQEDPRVWVMLRQFQFE